MCATSTIIHLANETMFTCNLISSTQLSLSAFIINIGGTSNSLQITYNPRPEVLSIYHPSCSIVNDSTTVAYPGRALEGCPALGGGSLTVIGTGFGPLTNHPITSSMCSDSGVHISVNGSLQTKFTCTLRAWASPESRIKIQLNVVSIGGVLETGNQGGDYPLITYSDPPYVSAVYHDNCYNNVNDALNLADCPIAGSGTITLHGKNFGFVNSSTIQCNVCDNFNTSSTTWGYATHVVGQMDTIITCPFASLIDLSNVDPSAIDNKFYVKCKANGGDGCN